MCIRTKCFSRILIEHSKSPGEINNGSFYLIRQSVFFSFTKKAFFKSLFKYEEHYDIPLPTNSLENIINHVGLKLVSKFTIHVGLLTSRLLIWRKLSKKRTKKPLANPHQKNLPIFFTRTFFT